MRRKKINKNIIQVTHTIFHYHIDKKKKKKYGQLRVSNGSATVGTSYDQEHVSLHKLMRRVCNAFLFLKEITILLQS